ncbi:amino acid permease [Secundilactobacillus similis]|uniref:APC family amino acid-polyamine-organocation transporter n=1 Tax=Secundilactobacillus similis DSM 23365 = JCM 2765 TaxID=1423804 RepID=A0A0R2FA47_9LACO|nr:amino acid permease [Secundilactobacillus similis]KRN24942.1 APC family amino acid-polyamine-organocation transporter [Secundilactobacillus similis DSM 23365 = JCM 2765]
MDKHSDTNVDGTKRTLSNRHVQMIALGGTIGTGLFLGASTSITKTGPSIILVYLIIGFFFFLMMRGIGEMLYQDPSQHTFIAFISRYLGQRTGYFAGWTYWIGLIFVGMAELTAVATYVQFWFPHAASWVIQVIFLAVLTSVNLIAVRLFGEAEFWFAMIKIVAILAMIATGVFMVFSQFKTPTGQVSLSNLTTGFTLFPNGIHSFIGAFPMVFFAFLGMEFIGITTAETKNPRHVLPKAINEIIYRILLFYIGALLVIMMIYPWHSLSTNQSPFVQVFALVGLKAAAAVINFVVLTSAASSLNSMIYSSGRHFYQLATESHSPLMRHFKTISTHGVPANGILISAVLILFAPVISALPAVSNAFSLITAASSDLYLIVYALTVVAHYRYRQSTDFMPDGFLMPAYKVLDPLLIVFFGVIYLSLFFDTSNLVPAVLGIVWCAGFGFFASREKSTVPTMSTER